MKVILQEDVKNVVKVGHLIDVAAGFARKFLFPKNLAMLATEKKKLIGCLKRKTELHKVSS